MRVFILCAGRTGSTTIIKACQFIENYTAAHESRNKLFGPERFEYPERHIEADNRLSWELGQLDKRFGKSAFYVHMVREREATSQSYTRRFFRLESIIDSFCQGIRNTPPETMSKVQRLQACYDYVDTINSNIEAFIAEKPLKMTLRLEHAKTDFAVFWERIEAEGKLDEALMTFDQRHNVSRPRKLKNYAYQLKLFLLRFYYTFLKL